MLFRKIFWILLIAVMAVGPVMAEDDVEVVAPWEFSLTTDFAYYPKSDYVTGESH